MTPMDVSVLGTIDQKTYLKKFRGGASALLALPGSAYEVPMILWWKVNFAPVASLLKEQGK